MSANVESPAFHCRAVNTIQTCVQSLVTLEILVVAAPLYASTLLDVATHGNYCCTKPTSTNPSLNRRSR